MRVLLFTGYYPPPFNANAVRAMYLVKALRQQGHDVIVVPLNASFNKEGFFGETIIPIANGKKNYSDEKFYKRPSIVARVFDIIGKHIRINKIVSIAKEYSPEVVIGTIPPIEAPPIAYATANSTRAKLVIDVQDLADDYRVLERPWLAPAIKLYFKQVYGSLKKADLVVVTTEYMKREIASRIGHNRITVVPNGVDNAFYSECFKIRTESYLPGLAVFLGDLNFKYHRLDVFIRALKVIRQQGVDLRLRIIGEGILLSKLKRLAEVLQVKDYIEFIGYVKREKLPKELGQALFGIAGRPDKNNPWILNTMRLTILEYLSCGLPILAYGPPNSYTQHFILESKIGIYIPTNDPIHIAEGVIRLITIIQKDPDITHRCRKIASEYDWNTVIEKFIKNIEKIY